MRNQCGISLIELMLVLLIIVIIVFTSTYYFRVTNENLKVTQTEEMINNIVDASYKWLQGNPNFQNLTNIQILVDAGFLPEKYDKSPWKSAITIKPSDSDNSKLLIQIVDIPEKSCINLAEKMKNYGSNVDCETDVNTDLGVFKGTF